MAPDGGKRLVAPRTLNVRKFGDSRTTEVECLYSILANRLGNNFQSRRNKRRRTTAHDNQLANRRYRKRQKDSQVAPVSCKTTISGKLPRRIRRRNELKENPQSGFCTSGDGTRRLRTHVWHAKRFTMTKLWGFYLPLGLHGRGRGSKALLKQYNQGVVLHDASYYFAVQLEGPEDLLISTMDRVLAPPSSAHPTDISHSILSGDRYGRAMLHHPGGSHSKPISPVMYIWRHLSEDTKSTTPFRQLWVWIHVSAFSEGYASLQCACQEEMDEKGSSINCSSLEGQLAKLEVMGSNSFKLLQKILRPITHASESPFLLKRHSSIGSGEDEQKIEHSVLHNEDGLPPHAILSLTVDDPRLYKDEVVDILRSIHIDTIDEVPSDQARKQVTMIKHLDEGVSSQTRHDLWHVASGIRGPIEENAINTERHRKHMDFFCLHDLNSGTSSLDQVQSSRSCPIMLVRSGGNEDHCVGWSIILPLSWVKAFWTPLVTKGAHVIGLREKHWIASNAQLPYFPWDYPDCNAYASLKADEAAASQLKADRRPPAIRPLKVPIPPPWKTICQYSKGCTAGVGAPISGVKSTNNGCSSSCSINSSSGVTASGVHDSSFNGVVIRTRKELNSFLDDNYGDYVFLFPYEREVERSFQKALKDKNIVTQSGSRISQVKLHHNSCFLRVLLHACNEGFIEEGAVICAPWYTDLSSGASRLDDDKSGLQMPQSAIASYFIEISPGKWEIQVPEDPTTRESHRQPIGFVTTGFVPGSKKPTAQAFCEATSLARLREEQWAEMPVNRRREEIHVLVRNLRSSAYRLALAIVVLEQQEDDLEYM